MLSLNYKPSILIDTSKLSKEEWLEYRTKGIGGSDVAAVMGCSPFITAREVYYDKKNIKPIFNDNREWVKMEVGNRLENLIGEIFAKKTGYCIYKPNKIFYHPFYPFMMANIDFIGQSQLEKFFILECKSTNIYQKNNLLQGKIPIHHILQVSHYMAVLNLDFVWIAYLCGNSENDFIMKKFYRNLKFEEFLIEKESYFWEKYILKNVPPPYVEQTNLVLKAIEKYFQKIENEPPLKIAASYYKYLEEYVDLKNQKSILENQKKNLNEKMEAICTPIIDKMSGSSSQAICQNGKQVYTMEYKITESPKISKDSLKIIKEEYPEIYKKFVTFSKRKTFSIKKLSL